MASVDPQQQASDAAGGRDVDGNAAEFDEDECMFPRRLRYTEEVLPLHYCDPACNVGGRPLKVYVRVKPAPPQAADAGMSMTGLEVTLWSAVPHLKRNTAEQYTFSQVYVDVDQQYYYEATVEPLVADLTALRVANSVFMSCGSSGTGKSYSMQGTAQQPGMVPQAITGIFKAVDEAAHEVHVSFYEVYDNKIYDLLRAAGQGHRPLQPQQHLQIQALGPHACCVPGLQRYHCTSAEAAHKLYQTALRVRKQAATGVNATSSRSHAVFTVQLVHKLTHKTSRLSLVDLAGAERAHRTKNVGARLKESTSINASLSVLGRCLEALRQNQSGRQQPLVIPVREASITNLFKDVLQGQGNLVLSVHVSQDPEDHEANRHSLKFGALATAIQVVAAAPVAEALQAPKARVAPIAEEDEEDADRKTSSSRDCVDALQQDLGEVQGAGDRPGDEAHGGVSTSEPQPGSSQLEELMRLRDEVRLLKEQVGSIEVETRDAVMQEMQTLLASSREEVEDAQQEAAVLREQLRRVEQELAQERAAHQPLRRRLHDVPAEPGTSGKRSGGRQGLVATTADVLPAVVQHPQVLGAVTLAGASAGPSKAAVAWPPLDDCSNPQQRTGGGDPAGTDAGHKRKRDAASATPPVAARTRRKRQAR